MSSNDPNSELAANLANALGISKSAGGSKVSRITSKIKKAPLDAALLADNPFNYSANQNPDPSAIHQNALLVEDDPWTQLQTSKKNNTLLPTYDPIQLSFAVQQNNTLQQCINAYETNIDGTGYEIERIDGEIVDKKDPNVQAIEAFFARVSPQMSMLSLRRKLRRDLEVTGNGYIEVVRDLEGKIAMLGYVDAKLTRLLRLDHPVPVETEMSRGQTKQIIKILKRERRFAMIIGNKIRYFKEYGASRDIDANSGEWLLKGTDPTTVSNNPLEAQQGQGSTLKGTEIIHFTAEPDVATPYGVPRWIPQVPSVLGGRKAEEYNLEFFDHGGIPPVIIMLQGGQLSQAARTQLTQYLSGSAKNKQRAVILEIFSTSGDINGASQVKSTVERFGAERQQDSMFENYDERCRMRIRSAFRLPPMFIGDSQDYNYATAMTSYLVAEAQVFKPERQEFDEQINGTIMREMFPGYGYRSLPMPVHQLDQQIQALTLVKGMVSNEEFVDEVNELAGLNLTYDEAMDQERLQQQLMGLYTQTGGEMGPLAGNPAIGQLVSQTAGKLFPAKPANTGTSPSSGAAPQGAADVLTGQPVAAPGRVSDANKSGGEERIRIGVSKSGKFAKIDDSFLSELADTWASYQMGDLELNAINVSTIQGIVKNMTPGVRKLFNKVVADKIAPVHKEDPKGIEKLITCATECLHGNK